jgi:hypothetical protein
MPLGQLNYVSGKRPLGHVLQLHCMPLSCSALVRHAFYFPDDDTDSQKEEKTGEKD